MQVPEGVSGKMMMEVDLGSRIGRCVGGSVVMDGRVLFLRLRGRRFPADRVA